MTGGAASRARPRASIADLIEFLLKHMGHAGGISCFALPNYEHSPAKRLQRKSSCGIALHVPIELRLPEVELCPGRRSEATTAVAMPEAAMDEYGHAMRGQHDVGRARQIAAM